MKIYLPLIIMFFVCILTISSSSTGEPFFPGEVGDGSPGGDPPLPHEPFIHSTNQHSLVLRLWCPPSPGVSVLYDQWEFFLFGEVNESYRIKIAGSVAFNGTLDREVVNLSFDAGAFNSVRVVVEIGNRSYTWATIRINHEEIGYSGSGDGGISGQYTKEDLRKASLRVAWGVVITSLLTVPLIWFGVRSWRERQGVRQL